MPCRLTRSAAGLMFVSIACACGRSPEVMEDQETWYFSIGDMVFVLGVILLSADALLRWGEHNKIKDTGQKTSTSTKTKIRDMNTNKQTFPDDSDPEQRVVVAETERVAAVPSEATPSDAEVKKTTRKTTEPVPHESLQDNPVSSPQPHFSPQELLQTKEASSSQPHFSSEELKEMEEDSDIQNIEDDDDLLPPSSPSLPRGRTMNTEVLEKYAELQPKLQQRIKEGKFPFEDYQFLNSLVWQDEPEME